MDESKQNCFKKTLKIYVMWMYKNIAKGVAHIVYFKYQKKKQDSK